MRLPAGANPAVTGRDRGSFIREPERPGTGRTTSSQSVDYFAEHPNNLPRLSFTAKQSTAQTGASV